MSVQEVDNVNLVQERMVGLTMQNTAEDVEAHRVLQAAAAVEGAGIGGDDGDVVMDQSDEEDEESQLRGKVEEEESSSVDTAGPYIPKLSTKATMTTCTICGQQIPVDELQEHMRIELLDPRWKSQRDALEARKAQVSELLTTVPGY